MCLASANEDRGRSVAVTGGAAALLLAELLARAGDLGPLPRRARRGATVVELPDDDPVQNIGTRLKAEHLIVQLDLAGSFVAPERGDLQLHGTQASCGSAAAEGWGSAFCAVG